MSYMTVKKKRGYKFNNDKEKFIDDRGIDDDDGQPKK